MAVNHLVYIIKHCILKKDPAANIIVQGDFNLHLASVTNHLAHMKLKGLFDQQTHSRGNQLDQVFTNMEVISTEAKNYTNSDHVALLATV